jgi:pSer/pThr/pTyr-binding forkhead associated (FHA) protein
MPPLAAIERFFERLFERPSARLFRTHVQPVQIQRRIERAMESGRRPAADRTLVPNRFIVHLNPDDLAGFAAAADGLAAGLADEALSFARAHHYALIDRPRVDLVPDPTVQRADIRIDARMTSPQAPDEAGPEISGSDAAARSDPAETAVFTLPQVAGPRARLRVTDPDGHTREVVLETGGLSIGRSPDNDLVARDPLVSRHHGRIAGRRGTLVYEDLGSANGSKVNGESVSQVVLGVGDRLQVGDTAIVLEVDEASD